MSVERHVRRALRRLFFWRIVGDLLRFPSVLLDTVGGFFRALEGAVFMFEIDAARSYYNLTGLDPADAFDGSDARYSAVVELSDEDDEE